MSLGQKKEEKNPNKTHRCLQNMQILMPAYVWKDDYTMSHSNKTINQMSPPSPHRTTYNTELIYLSYIIISILYVLYFLWYGIYKISHSATKHIQGLEKLAKLIGLYYSIQVHFLLRNIDEPPITNWCLTCSLRLPSKIVFPLEKFL